MQIIFAKLKKWWWLSILALVGIVVVVVRGITRRKSNADLEWSKKTVQNVRDAVRDADTQALIEKARVEVKTAEQMATLKEVEKISDGKIRRERLAELFDEII